MGLIRQGLDDIQRKALVLDLVKYVLVLVLAIEHSLSMSRYRQRPLPTVSKIQYTPCFRSSAAGVAVTPSKE